MSLTLLIAEDDRDLAEVIAYGARQAWPACRVTIAADGREALARFVAERPDLVVLDVAMPPPDGIEVCRRNRRESSVPILMLTVRGGLLDKVRALDIGADDYLTKPFDHLELLARLRALVRRATITGALISRSSSWNSLPVSSTTRPALRTSIASRSRVSSPMTMRGSGLISYPLPRRISASMRASSSSKSKGLVR